MYIKHWRIQEFRLGGAVYAQVKKLNNKIRYFNILSKGLLESRGCDYTYVVTLGSATRYKVTKHITHMYNL